MKASVFDGTQLVRLKGMKAQVETPRPARAIIQSSHPVRPTQNRTEEQRRREEYCYRCCCWVPLLVICNNDLVWRLHNLHLNFYSSVVSLCLATWDGRPVLVHRSWDVSPEQSHKRRDYYDYYYLHIYDSFSLMGNYCQIHILFNIPTLHTM